MEWSASEKGFTAKILHWKQDRFKNVRGCATGRKKIINWRKRSRELIATLKKNKNAKLTTHAHAKEKRGLQISQCTIKIDVMPL